MEEIKIEEVRELKPGSLVMMDGKPYVVVEHPLYGIRLERIKTPEEIEMEKERLRKALSESAKVFGKAVEKVAKSIGESIKEWLEERKKAKEEQETEKIEKMREEKSKEKLWEAM